MTRQSPLKLATVGTGYFSRFQYAAWDRIPEVILSGICNRTIEPANELAQQYGSVTTFTNFENMLDQIKPDLVDIITPPVTHMDYVKAAVDRDITTICQKPFTTSLQDAKSLVDYITHKKGKVVIHENFRFQPWYLTLKDLLNKDSIGDLYQISFRLRPGDGQGVNAYMDRQPYFQQMERLLVHETAVHLIDVFRYLFGEVNSIYADLRRVNPVIKGEDAGIIIFNFANETRGIFDGNRLGDHRAKNRRLTMGEMQIEGELGTLFLNGDGEIFRRDHGENDEIQITYDWLDQDFGGDCVYNFQRHVVDHLINGKELMNPAEDYLRNVEIAEASYISAKKGQTISI